MLYEVITDDFLVAQTIKSKTPVADGWGAMRDQFPDLPQFEATDLAELRTLTQIVQSYNFV